MEAVKAEEEKERISNKFYSCDELSNEYPKTQRRYEILITPILARYATTMSAQTGMEGSRKRHQGGNFNKK